MLGSFLEGSPADALRRATVPNSNARKGDRLRALPRGEKDEARRQRMTSDSTG